MQRTRLIAEPGKNAKDWAIRSQAPTSVNLQGYGEGSTTKS